MKFNKLSLIKNQIFSLGLLFFIRTFLSLSAGLVIPIFVIKSISLSSYGEFVFLSTLGLVLLLISELGLNGVFLRNGLNLTASQSSEYLYKTFLLRVITFQPFAVLAFLLAVVVNHYKPAPNFLSNILLVIASTFFLTLQGFLYLTNLGLRRNYPQMLSEVMGRSLWLLGAYPAAKYYGVTGLLAVSTISALTQVMVGGIGLIKPSNNKNYTYTEIWNSSHQFGISTILMGLLNKIDILLIGIFFGSAFTGAYGYGSRIRDFFIDLVGTSSSSYFKKFSAQDDQAVKRLGKMLAYIAALLGGLGFPFALIVSKALADKSTSNITLSIMFFSFSGILIVLNQNIIWALMAKNLIKQLNLATLYNTLAKGSLIILSGYVLSFKGLLLALFLAEVLYLQSLTQILKDKHNYLYLLAYLPLLLIIIPTLLTHYLKLPLTILTTLVIIILLLVKGKKYLKN